MYTANEIAISINIAQRNAALIIFLFSIPIKLFKLHIINYFAVEMIFNSPLYYTKYSIRTIYIAKLIELIID